MNTAILNSVVPGGSVSVSRLRKLISAELIASGSILRRIVSSLPPVSVAEPNVMYLVPREDGNGSDYYDEYLLIDSKFERVGSTGVNLEGYVTEEQLRSILATITPVDKSEPARSIEAPVSFVGEAPMNGHAHVRKNGLWDDIDSVMTSSAEFVGTADSPVELRPNVYHKYCSVSALYFSLPSVFNETDEFLVEFSCAGSVGYPSTIRWSEQPEFKAGSTYVISIVNNLGLVAEFHDS